MLIFQNEGHLYGNCLFYILPIYRKFLLFQFLSSAKLTFLKNFKTGELEMGDIFDATLPPMS